MAELFGERISSLRRAKGLSQGQLAEELNISSCSIGIYGQGRCEPSLALIVELAILFIRINQFSSHRTSSSLSGRR